MEPRFEQFIREKQYLTNVTPATVSWYTCSLKWLPSVHPTQDELKDVVLQYAPKRAEGNGLQSGYGNALCEETQPQAQQGAPGSTALRTWLDVSLHGIRHARNPLHI